MAYATADDVYMIYGRTNVDRWADLDNTGNTSDIGSRISHALSVAQSEVDSILAGSPIVVPIIGTVPTLIQDVTATLAGVLLYEARGAQGISTENGQVLHPYSFRRSWALSVLKDLREGRRRIQGL